MYEISVDGEFCAAHAIVIRGEMEPVHGHNFRVRVTVAGERLDTDGLLCDFHEIQRLLDGAISVFKNRSLNQTQPFDRVNPTAERIAEHVAIAVQAGLESGVRVESVSVTEAPGCMAVYRPATV